MTCRRRISIIICTRDRRASLQLTLQSLVHALVPEDIEAELIVVDNGSSDNTHEVLKDLSFPMMKVRCVAEARKGKGFAYNTGVAAAGGEVLLFTDDDVRVPGNWIEGMCRPILDGNAEAVQGGVRLAPHLDRPWLNAALRLWLAAVEHPEVRPEGLVGANMAIQHDALASTGGFDPRLGPGAAGFYDDTVVGWAIERAGGRILYLPNVAIEHHFDPDRLKIGSFLLIARRMAESKAIVMKDATPRAERPSFFGLLCELPGFFFRSLTQALNLIREPRPDSGFLFRYFRICFWAAMRRD